MGQAHDLDLLDEHVHERFYEHEVVPFQNSYGLLVQLLLLLIDM